MPEHRAERLIGAAPDYYLARNVTRIPLSAELFARDSQPLHGEPQIQIHLRAGARHRPPHPRGYRKLPYTLIWSTPQKPMRFICVEPWHSIPGEDDGPIEWAQKPLRRQP